MKAAIRFWREEKGSGAAEFTLVLIPFSALVFGIIHACLLFYANQALQFSTEAAARCFSVDANNCASTGAVQSYASGKYKGPNIGATFVASTAGCGHTVTGSGNYSLNAVVITQSIPLAAKACFP